MKSERIIVEKSNAAVIALSIIAVAVSFAALAVGVAAIVRTFAGKRITTAEYPFSSEEDEDEESIGSDTLAF